MPLPHASSDTLGLCSNRLTRLQKWMQQQIDSHRLMGLSLGIGRHGHIAFQEATGDLQLDSVVRLYSMTKPVTAVAAMMLYEQGCFQFDDPISWYLPEFEHMRVWDQQSVDLISQEDCLAWAASSALATQAITVKHLMTHTAGLSYSFMHSTPVDAYYRLQGLEFPGATESLSSLVSRLADAPLLCEPGTAWNYSVASDVLGRLVEIWSGESLDSFFHQGIFVPLQMDETGFFVKPECADRFSHLYGPAAGGDLSALGQAKPDAQRALSSRDTAIKHDLPVVLDNASESPFLTSPTLYSGGGGLVGTLDNYSRFSQMLLNDGELEGNRILGRKTVQHMRCNHLPNNQDMAAMGQAVWSESTYHGIGFGLGFATVLDPRAAHIMTSTGEYHWGGAASTFFWIDPEEDLWVVLLAQLYPSSTYPIRKEVRSMVYQALID